MYLATLQCARNNISKENLNKKIPPKTWKNHPQKLLIIGLCPQFFFCTANISPKSHFLFHRNVSLRNFYLMTLVIFNNFLHLVWLEGFITKSECQCNFLHSSAIQWLSFGSVVLILGERKIFVFCAEKKFIHLSAVLLLGI